MLTLVAAVQARAPWWQWLMLSLSSAILSVLWVAAALWVLAVAGLDLWDLLDYMVLKYPPWITDGTVAAGIAMLLASQTLPGILILPLFRPARALVFARLRWPKRVAPMWRRLGVGVVFCVAVQAIWSLAGIEPAEQWRIVEHLTYATVRGGRFWPMFWLLVPIGVVLPLAEELFFRGLLFGLLRRRWRFWPSAIATAAFFGLGHGLAAALPAMAIGLFLAYQAEADESLVGAALLHALNNLGALLILVAQLAK